MLIDKDKDPALYLYVSDRNLLRQYDYLTTTIKVCLATDRYPIHLQLLCELNKHAVEYISPTAGEVRQRPIYIQNSNHSPPDHGDVDAHLREFFDYFATGWSGKEAIHLAAYALWRINWIHPFVEGNGRTARAFSYFVLCAKLGYLLPGKNIIPHQIRENRMPYYQALAAADEAYKVGNLDVSALEAYLSQLLTIQLSE